MSSHNQNVQVAEYLPPCTQLLCGKFELTNQDSAGGKNFTVLMSMYGNRKGIDIRQLFSNRNFLRKKGISWKVDKSSQMEFLNGKYATHLLVFIGSWPFGLDCLWSYHSGKTHGNGTSTSLWKFPFGIWRISFTITVDQPFFPSKMVNDLNVHSTLTHLFSRGCINGTSELMLGVTPWWTSIPSRGE